MNRNRLIAGIAILVVFSLLLIAGLVSLLRRSKAGHPQAGQRILVSDLTYCNANDLRPCIVSFSLDTGDNTLLVNILIPAGSYPDFYLTISNANEEHTYECQPVDEFPTNFYCTGKEMYPGTLLHFAIISSDDERVLAEGDFAIIGLLLVTPGVKTTEAVESANESTETPDLFSLNTLTPAPPITDSTATATEPSYPNPSYP